MALVALGVDVHAMSTKGQTALQISAANKQHAVERALTEVGECA